MVTLAKNESVEFVEVHTFSTPYGKIPMTNGQRIYSEDAQKIMREHFTTKKNYRGFIKMSLHERHVLKNRMHSHPDKNHCPTQFNQVIKVQ